MAPTLIALTPEQQAFLAALSRQTGKAVSTLLAEALEGLQVRVHSDQVTRDTNGGPAEDAGQPSARSTKHIWDIATDLLEGVADETLDRLPADGAAEHDHYIYGTPKRSA